MSDYLNEAAAELRKARESNERRFGLIPSLAAGNLATADVLREVNDRRMDLAEGFTRLAAIERGLPPCCHHEQPGQDPEDSP